MRKIIFFDFDGTLYPFRPYDSEDLLFCLAAQTNEEKIKAEKLRIADETGSLPFQEIRDGEIELLKGKSVSCIDEDVRFINEKAGKDFLDPLKRLHLLGFEMYVVSCGLSDIAEGYLKLQGVRDLFSGIFAKNLIISNGKIRGIDYSEMSSKEDKKKVALKILSDSNGKTFSVSVGDGFTDLPMFSASDKAVFIDHGQNPFKQVRSIIDCGYPITKSIGEMVEYIEELNRAL